MIAPANRAKFRYSSIVIASADRAKIDDWIAQAPDYRRIETEPLASDAWEIRAVEDGQIVFEDAEVDTDQPMLRRLARWCEQNTKRAVKPPVKASSTPERQPLRRSAKS